MLLVCLQFYPAGKWPILHICWISHMIQNLHDSSFATTSHMTDCHAGKWKYVILNINYIPRLFPLLASDQFLISVEYILNIWTGFVWHPQRLAWARWAPLLSLDVGVAQNLRDAILLLLYPWKDLVGGWQDNSAHVVQKPELLCHPTWFVCKSLNFQWITKANGLNWFRVPWRSMESLWNP